MSGAIGRLTIAYGVLVLLLVIGAFRFEQQRADIVLESERRAYDLCISVNELRFDIGDYLRSIPPRPSVPPLEDKAAEEYLQDLVERERELASFSSRFDALECPPEPR